MKTFLKIARWLLVLALAGYVLVCGSLYFFQEKLIFFPHKLPDSYAFNYDKPFEEITINTSDGVRLSGLLFRADSSKGLVFYLHGNGGALDTWGNAAGAYLDLHYDFFVLDYRGYGKSGGEITGERQFYSDVQSAYDYMKSKYDEENIIVTGYSIGTGAAAYLASVNKPQRVILQAPYYSLTDLALAQYPFIPEFLLKYRFETYRFIKNTRVPVVIFHGDEDRLISIESSYRLKDSFKPGDRLFVIHGLGHNGMNDNPDYRNLLGKYLSEVTM